MLTNTDCTVYNVHEDDNGSIIIVRTHLDAVHWEPRKAVNVFSSGMKDADSLSVWIPLCVGSGGSLYLDPVIFSSLDSPAGYWTLDENTYFVKGDSPDVADMKELKSLLKTTSEQFKVSIVDPKMFGSIRLQHWQVTGK